MLIHGTDLEPPPSPYALDKAVWAVHLIELVLFDLANHHVQVKMVDGACMEWSMRGEEHLLNQVMDDVEASKNEAESEQREQERKYQEDIAAAAAAASAAAGGTYLPFSQHSVSDAGHYEKGVMGSGSKTSHRRSKSLFSSLLSALNLNSSSESSAEYRIGGRSHKEQAQPETDGGDDEIFTYPAYAVTALSTSEYTYPMRAQLSTNDFPSSKVLRRRARSTLVDCFRRWIIPTVRERLQWGAFPPFDTMYNDSIADLMGECAGDGVKWGKMSKATNAYADWACRSMISRCERALRTANASAAVVASISEEGPDDGRTEMSEKESRRSSASSMPASAISASSRASSSAEASETDGDASPATPSMASPAAPTFQSASTKSSRRSSASVRHVATLKTALDRFKDLHEKLAMEAIGLAEAHTAALRMLEARGRRRGWSSSEGGGLGRSPLGLGAKPIVPRNRAPAPLASGRQDHEYGTGASIWELSIPLMRSTLGEVSETWEDLQMEWEMEKEFGSDGELLDEEDFPGIISDFDTSADAESLLPAKSKSGRRSDATSTGSFDEDPTECGHSGFSDSSSEDEMDSDDVGSDRSPTSPSELEAAADGKVVKARRGRRTGVKARMGKYEDVRNELPPDPPLMALSPPPRGKFATRPAASGESGIGSSLARNESGMLIHSLYVLFTNYFLGPENHSRPVRAARPARLQVPPPISSHRREAASATYPDFAQSRVDDTEAGVFDDWDGVDDDDNVFGRPPNAEVAIQSSGEISAANKSFHMFDGLGILEQVGGATNAAQAVGPAYVSSNSVGVGYPPGLHGDLPSPPSSPKRAAIMPESPRRASHYVPRDLPPSPGPDVVPSTMEKDTKRTARPRPRLTLAFPEPPTHDPSGHQPKGRSVSLPYTRSYQSMEELSGSAHGSSTHIMEKDTPALLLDTPTAEHPLSSYPYTWDVNVLPPGVKVVGTVGVTAQSKNDDMIMEMPGDIESAGCTASSSSPSSGTGPFTAVAKVLSKVRKVKPVLYVTPPIPSDGPVEVPQGPRRLQKLNRSKSWKDLSSGSGGLNVRPDVMKRRKSADSVPIRVHPETDTPPMPTPVSPASASAEGEEEEGDKTIILDGAPCLSPTSTVSRTNSEMESGWNTPALISGSSSLSSSPLSSVNSTALDIAGGYFSPDSRFNDAYDGIVMAPRQAGADDMSDSMSLDEALQLQPTTTSTISTCPTAGPKTLKRANSATPVDDRQAGPPPRPAKSLKRSLSLNTFGKKTEVRE